MGFPGHSDDKESAGNAGSNLGLIPHLERSSGRRNGIPSRILAWRIPWTEEPGRLQSTGSQRVGHDLATKQQSVDVKIGGVLWIIQVSPASSQKWKRAAGVSYTAGFEDEEPPTQEAGTSRS